LRPEGSHLLHKYCWRTFHSPLRLAPNRFLIADIRSLIAVYCFGVAFAGFASSAASRTSVITCA
jgi:hypothetical protein